MKQQYYTSSVQHHQYTSAMQQPQFYTSAVQQTQYSANTQPTKTVHREYVTTSPTTTGYVVQPHVTHVVEPRVTYVQEPRTYIEYVPQVTYVAQERTTYETVPRTEYETKSYATYDVQPIVEQKQVLIEQEVPIYYHGATEQVVYGQTQYGGSACCAQPTTCCATQPINTPFYSNSQCCTNPHVSNYSTPMVPSHQYNASPAATFSCCPPSAQLPQHHMNGSNFSTSAPMVASQHYNSPPPAASFSCCPPSTYPSQHHMNGSNFSTSAPMVASQSFNAPAAPPPRRRPSPVR